MKYSFILNLFHRRTTVLTIVEIIFMEEEKEITVPVLVGAKRPSSTNLDALADATQLHSKPSKQLNFTFTFQQEIEKATREVLNKKPKIDSLFSTLQQRSATSATSKVVVDGSGVLLIFANW